MGLANLLISEPDMFRNHCSGYEIRQKKGCPQDGGQPQ